MGAAVDLEGRLVRLGERAAPFRLQPRRPAACIELAGRAYTLRPLRWRDKRWLAHVAPLGGALLQEQFLLLCLEGEDDALPEDEIAREMLWALAAWLNAPAGPPGLPTDAGVLGEVTLRLCRAMGLAPASLDDRYAYEVESLYAALDEPELAATPAPASRTPPLARGAPMTRINVIPDPRPAAASDARAAVAPNDAASAPPITPDRADRSEGDAPRPREPDFDQGVPAPVGWPRRARLGHRMRIRSAPPVAVSPPPRCERSDGPESRRDEAAAAPARAGPTPANGAASATLGRHTEEHIRSELRSPEALHAEEPQRPIEQAPAAQHAEPGLGRRLPGFLLDRHGISPWPERPPAAAPGAPSIAPAGPVGGEDFADALAEAAEDLGLSEWN